MSEKKETYEEEAKAQLDKLNAELEFLHEKEEELSAEARVEYGEQLEELEALRERVRQRLKNLQQAGDKAWTELRTGLEDALKSLQRGVDKARERFEREVK